MDLCDNDFTNIYHGPNIVLDKYAYLNKLIIES
jgi:hypothetical protein